MSVTWSSLRQLRPLEQNPVTKEPFLRLSAPHENIILTPFRSSDVEPTIEILNDMAVVQTLIGPPYPYTPKDAQWWVTECQKKVDAVMSRLQTVEGERGQDGELEYVDECLIRAIREEREDGSDVFLGDVAFVKSQFNPEVLDKDERAIAVATNEAKGAGDPTIVWQVGYYLTPSHHGKGIMSAAMKTLLERWGIPRMNIRYIRANAFLDNMGSRRVMEKNGFVFERVAEDAYDISEAKGGGKKGVYLLEWRYKE